MLCRASFSALHSLCSCKPRPCCIYPQMVTTYFGLAQPSGGHDKLERHLPRRHVPLDLLERFYSGPQDIEAIEYTITSQSTLTPTHIARSGVAYENGIIEGIFSWCSYQILIDMEALLHQTPSTSSSFMKKTM
jgi:hypothetical protein